MNEYTGVIPVHNGAMTIHGALESFAAQSILPKKIVVFDNASTDMTSQKVAEFAAKSQIPVEIFRSDSLLTPNKSFENSLTHIQGRFLWLAADDILFPWAAEKLLNVQCGKSCTHSLAGTPVFFDKNAHFYFGKEFSNPLTPTNFLSDPSDASFIYGMHVAEEIRGNFPSQEYPAWDWGFLFKILGHGVHFYGPLPTSLRESTEIETHRNKISKEKKLTRYIPYLKLSKDVLRGNKLKNKIFLIPTLFMLNMKGYLYFGIHSKMFSDSNFLRKLVQIKKKYRNLVGLLLRNLFLQKIYSYLPLRMRIKFRIIINNLKPALEEPTTQKSLLLNPSLGSERSRQVSLSSPIMEFEFSPSSSFNTAQIIEIITFFLTKSANKAKLILDLKNVAVNEEFIKIILIGLKRLFPNNAVEFTKTAALPAKDIDSFYSSIWANEFMMDFGYSIQNHNAEILGPKKIVNVFLPEIPQPNRDAGSVDAIYLLTILQKLGVEVNIYLAHTYTSNPMALALLSNFGEIKLVSEFESNDQLNIIYGPYAYSFFSPFVVQNRFTYILVDAVFRRNEQNRGEISHQDKNALKYETAALQNCDFALCISESDRNAVRERFPLTKTKLFPIIRFKKQKKADLGRIPKAITFIGSLTHTPNQIAVEWIVKELAPKLLASNPGITILLAGLGTEKYDRYSSNVVGLGMVLDLAELYGKTFVTLAPMKVASGINGKVIESLCYGVTPIISNEVALNLPSSLRKYCIIAETSQEFVSRIVSMEAKESDKVETEIDFESVDGTANIEILRSLLDNFYE